jgi:hypothetical protein
MDAVKDTFVCPYNMEVDCEQANCQHCGWYPPVAKERKKQIMALKLYRIPFTGFCEVWAKTPEEAAEKAEDIKAQFFAHYDYGYPVCLSKEDENELDR